jgi:hypothetical protein
MKKNIIYILMSFLFLTFSCTKEDNGIKTYDLGTEFFIDFSGYTSLDSEATFTITNQQKNLSEVKITNTGGLTTEEDENGDLIPFDSNYSGTIAIGSDGTGSITVTDADLGMTKVGWTADFQFDSKFDSKSIVRYQTVEVEDPITINDPGVTHRADTTFYITFAVEPVTATVDNVSVQWKTSSLADYSDVAGTFEAVDSVAVAGADYAVGDTIFVKVTGTAGTKTQSKVAEIVVNPYSFLNEAAFMLDTTTNQAYDLIENRYVESTSEFGDSADIQFVASYPLIGGPVEVGFESNNNAEFIMGTADDYDYGDVNVVETADFSSAVTVVSDVKDGDVFMYRTKRGSGDYVYGIMKVAVFKPQGVLEDSYLEISYKY